MFRRIAVALLAGIIAMLALAPAAAADPKGTPISSVCDDGNAIALTFNGNGNFTPGHLVGGTAVYVVQSLESTRVFTPLGGAPQTTYFAAYKPHIHGDLVTCHFDFTVTSPEGTFHGFGTLVAAPTPAS
jgi:hypothetical protein